MDDLVALELGRLKLALIKQTAIIDALKAELGKRDAAIALLKSNEPELPLALKNGANGHAAAH